MNIRTLVAFCLLVFTLGPPTTIPSFAQDSGTAAPAPPKAGVPAAAEATSPQDVAAKGATPQVATPIVPPVAPPVVESGPGFSGFMHDVGGDYKGFFSTGVALRLGLGGAAAGIVHIWDDDIKENATEASSSVTNFLKGGEYLRRARRPVPAWQPAGGRSLTSPATARAWPSGATW